jgi:hypothetical protein
LLGIATSLARFGRIVNISYVLERWQLRHTFFRRLPRARRSKGGSADPDAAAALTRLRPPRGAADSPFPSKLDPQTP